MPLEVNEALVKAVAIKEKTIEDGRGLSKKGSFKNTFKSADGTLLWCECQGSALYKLSVDVAGDKPLMRCSCPVKPPPCKHILGMLLHYIANSGSFKQAEPPADLMEKRGKAEVRAENAAKPKKVDVKALEKKTKEQRDALDLLEKLVLDLASGGLGTVDAKKAKRLFEQSKQLTDAYLKGAAFAVRRLASLANVDASEGINDDERLRLMMRQLVRLWAIVRKGQKYLDEKLEEGETQGDADAVVEELLGRDWKIAELKEMGSVRRNVELLELAFERYDDPIREERIELSHLVELNDGTVYADINMRPQGALEKTKEKESFEDLVTVPEAVIYPGFVNRRVRWELLQMKPRPIAKTDWERLHKAALLEIAPALANFKEQIKNPLAPDDAVFLLKVKDIVKVPAGIALIDEKGARLLIQDPPLARYKTAANLELAGGAAGKGGPMPSPCSMLVRLWLGLQDYGVRGQALALVVGDQRIRLGM